MAYTYWCLEKGYAQGNTEDIQETKNWIRTMQTDVWVTIFFITIGTLPFFFLGAGVLNTLPQLQESLATQSFWDVDIINALQNMFSLLLGDWAKWLFIVLAFFILYSTLLSGTAAFTRTISDYLISMGFIYEKENTRKRLIKLIAFLVPFFSGVFYFLLPNPITLLLIAGIWAAMGLPIVNIGAIYLSNKLQKELQPSLFIKLILWLSLLFQLSIAVLIVIDISANF
jgi:Mn2+/Fe2+ NRAMP family transporter